MTICPRCHAILPTHNPWCPDVQPPPVYSNSTTTPADVTREPTGGQGLREAVARGLESLPSVRVNANRPGEVPGYWTGRLTPPETTHLADAVLALPELAALIADAERVQRVRELHTADADGGCGGCWDGCWHCDSDHAIEDCATRRALDGEPQP